MLALVADFPGLHRVGKSSVSAYEWERVLNDSLREAGIIREKVERLAILQETPPRGTFAAASRFAISEGVDALHERLRRLKPRVIVAFGAEACHALVEEWPDGRVGGALGHRGDIRRATDIENRRGYVFDSVVGVPVVAATHPASVARAWSPWRALLTQDLLKAQRISRDGCVRPTRNVEIIGSDRDARRALSDLRRFRVLSSDIETRPDTSLACIGFAGESGKAYVFPAQYLDRASELLGSRGVTTVWANGIYDLFVLKHRCGVKFQARVDDAQIAWHSAYPELAGAKEDRKKHRFTRKSLSFLASLTTMDKWWKGDYETEEEFFVYNGKDCAITLDVWDYVMKAVEDVGAEDVYEHERSLMWPCVDMLARGLNVDDGLRRERVEALSARAEEVSREAFEVVRPLLDRVADELERLEVRHLFEETDPTCTCCGHGKNKQFACWACAGFEKAPTKAEMLDKLEFDKKTKRSKEDLARELLPVCHVCCGAPRETRWTFNANSTEQMKTLLYDVLRLPKKMKDGRPTVDEAALKALLGGIPT